MAKQLVFLVNTGADGSASQDAQCLHRGGLSGLVKHIAYIPDGRVPYDDGATFYFVGSKSGVEVFRAENVSGRQEWNLEGPDLKNEPITVTVTHAGQGKSGSFVVTCA